MAYKIKFKKSISKDLRKIDKSIANNLIDEIVDKLSKNPIQGKKLQGKFIGKHRIDIGNYRVIYAIQPELIWVLKIGHRQGVYKG